MTKTDVSMLRDRVLDFLVKFFPAYVAEDGRLLEGVSYLVVSEVTHALAQQHQRFRAQIACPR